MKIRFLAAVLCLAALALVAAPATAKPLYCNYQCYWPYYHGPLDWCTCPPGSFNYGDVIQCFEYFEAYCAGALAPPEATDELLAEIFAPADQQVLATEAVTAPEAAPEPEPESTP
jgi:hypothetical protein